MIIATLNGEPLNLDADGRMVWLGHSTLSHPLDIDQVLDCQSGRLNSIQQALTPYLGAHNASQLKLAS
jgi:hypothetical protein